MSDDAIAVVVVAHDSADDLPRTLGALSDQLGPRDEIVVVDNGSSDGSAEAARAAFAGGERRQVIETGANVGFAGGCHAGVAATSAPLVLLLNPDCEVASGCLAALRAAAAERPGWGAWQALVTLPGGERVNTAGNCVHYLGFGWAGRLDAPVASVPADPHDVGFVSGAALLIRRRAWEDTGGFDERYFMYGEDLDLSLRLRLAGHGVGIVPAARVAHEYEFAKGDYKWFYLERNRWWTVLGVYPAPLLALLTPALLAFEIVLLAASRRGGWSRAKLRAQAVALRELPQILARRRSIQGTRRVSARAFSGAFVATLDSPHLALGRAVPGAEPLQALYWWLVVAMLRLPARRRSLRQTDAS